jgi:hypothetical protein
MWKTVLRFDAQWEPGQFSSPIRISQQVLMVVLTGWFSLRNRTGKQRQFSAHEWEPPNTGQKTRSNSVCHKKWCISEFDPPPWRLMYFFTGFLKISPGFGPNSVYWCHVFLTLWKTLLCWTYVKIHLSCHFSRNVATEKIMFL